MEVAYKLISVSDGLSSTLLFGEKHVRRENLLKEVREPGVNGGSNSVVGDGPILNSFAWNLIRVCGANYPLALGPDDANAQEQFMFGSYHPGTCNFVFGDGSVKALRTRTDTTTLARLSSRATGTVPSSDY